MTDTEATCVSALENAPGVAGAFEYYVVDDGETVAGMIYRCPCGCNREGALAFTGHVEPGETSWTWSGDRKKPTLTPSVHHIIAGQTHWHGHLTDGTWRPC